jgi:RHS repeat-associated protein
VVGLVEVQQQQFEWQPVERYLYTPYGAVTVLGGSFVPRNPNQTQYAWDIGYAGYRLDLETLLHQVRNRYYHSELGRWVSRDPIGYAAADVNLYRYVLTQPISMVDSFGETGFPPYPGYDYPTMDFSKWQGRASACAGTLCREDVGVKTFINTKRDKSCDHACKKFLWEVQEGEHRKNMQAVSGSFSIKVIPGSPAILKSISISCFDYRYGTLQSFNQI